MKRIDTPYWYGKKSRAVTFSYDDGRVEDVRLVEIFNKYGLKASFHLCQPEELAKLANGPLLGADKYAELYRGHEISCHSVHHSFPASMPDEAVRAEIYENRRFLEGLCGYPVRGMSYPFGSYDDRVISICKSCGMEYARTVEETGKFKLPEDFMRWHPTCHHSEADSALVERFMRPMLYDRMRLLYVWGHSFEFYNEEKWQAMENFCREISGRDDVWYATNIEIVDYMHALRSLRFAEQCTSVYNPTCMDLWIDVDTEPVLIPAGQTVKL